MCDGIKHFDKTIAAAEYHTRGLFSAVILIPKGDVSDEEYFERVTSSPSDVGHPSGRGVSNG